mmetsp:Transcript_34004/g.49808  ORF Transcript_34004/g.49808 Transcript_34004/m.49808 type:complete len:348 (-) Transcript_34004:592-1635(-)
MYIETHTDIHTKMHIYIHTHKQKYRREREIYKHSYIFYMGRLLFSLNSDDDKRASDYVNPGPVCLCQSWVFSQSLLCLSPCTAHFHPGVSARLCNRESFLHVSRQQSSNKGLGCSAHNIPHVALEESAVVGNGVSGSINELLDILVNLLTVIVAAKGHCACDHYMQNYTQPPEVCLLAIRLEWVLRGLSQSMHLRRHVLRRAAICAAYNIGAIQSFSKTKVGDFQQRVLTRGTQQDVFWLEIAVHYIHIVAVANAFEQVRKPSARHVFRNAVPSLPDEKVKQVTARHHFEHDKDVSFVFEISVHVDNIGMHQLLVNGELSKKLRSGNAIALNHPLCIINYLDSHFLP